MAINKKLIHFQTKENFQTQLDNGNILDTSICFIKDTKEIWTHGLLYNCDSENVKDEIYNEITPIFEDIYRIIESKTHIGEDGEIIVGDDLKQEVLDEFISMLESKVDKEEGKSLSSNDFTDEDKSKLNSLENYDDTEIIQTLENKVNKVEGKQLSTEDFTTLLKEKLDSLNNYDDTELSTKIETLKSRLDTILDSENTSEIIDTFQEIEAFLQGITNTETLTGLLEEMKSNVLGEVNSSYAKKSGDTINGDLWIQSQSAEYPYRIFRLGLNEGYQTVIDNPLFVNDTNGRNAAFRLVDSSNNSNIGAVILASNGIYYRGTNNTNNTIWHSGNDGAGSGLDADLLDGKHSSSFVWSANGSSINLNTIGNQATMGAMNGVGTIETGFPIEQGGGYISFGLLNTRPMQIYGSYISNRWFARGANTNAAGDFTSWREFAFIDSTVDATNKLNTTQLTNADDLNDIVIPGKYYFSAANNTIANKPSNVTAFHLSTHLVSSIVNLVLIDLIGKVYSRIQKNSTTWSDWKQILTEDNLPKEWVGTLEEYDALSTKDENTTYYITE